MVKFTNSDNTLVIESNIGADGTGSLKVSEGNLSVDIYRHSQYGQGPSCKVNWGALGSQSPECAATYAQVLQVASELAVWIDGSKSSVKFLNEGRPFTIPSTSEFRQNGTVVFES